MTIQIKSSCNSSGTYLKFISLILDEDIKDSVHYINWWIVVLQATILGLEV